MHGLVERHPKPKLQKKRNDSVALIVFPLPYQKCGCPADVASCKLSLLLLHFRGLGLGQGYLTGWFGPVMMRPRLGL